MAKQQEQFSENYGFKEELLNAAIKARASDVHIDPTGDSLHVRFRVDGIMTTWMETDLSQHESLITQLKVIAELDVTEHQHPQNGHFMWFPHEGSEERRALNVRILVMPTVHGEAAILRVFNRPDILKDMKDLGLTPEDLHTVEKMISLSHGMVLVTGPMSAGKTTTLYSFINKLSIEHHNIVTLEDPVEYYFDTMVRQSEIRPELGYTYAVGIRSILRQDPDTIMIGEIRDFETAENAFRISLTGRLVLSTLHVSDSVGAISRLVDMHVERSMVAYALKGVINQRLVGKICEHCKEPYQAPGEVVAALGLDQSETFYRGAGCKQCGNTGFFQRIPLFEVLPIDDDLLYMIMNNTSFSEMKDYLKKKNFKTLRDDGIHKIREGLTTPEEVLKQTSSSVLDH